MLTPRQAQLSLEIFRAPYTTARDREFGTELVRVLSNFSDQQRRMRGHGITLGNLAETGVLCVSYAGEESKIDAEMAKLAKIAAIKFETGSSQHKIYRILALREGHEASELLQLQWPIELLVDRKVLSDLAQQQAMGSGPVAVGM